MIRLQFPGSSPGQLSQYNRRSVMEIGSLSACGLSLGQLFAQPSFGLQSPHHFHGFGKAKSCILIFLFGGPSQIDLFDMKPDAPAEFRGAFKPINTSVPGIDLCEHLPQIARRMHLFQIIRSMHHEHPRHGWGLYYMLTGQKHSRPDLDAPPTPEDFPGIGSLVSHFSNTNAPGFPSAITLPRWNRFLDLPSDYAGERGGRLGQAATPWLVKSDIKGNLIPDEFQLETLIAPGRIADRAELLKNVEAEIAGFGEAETFSALQNVARNIVTSPKARRAFQLNDEPATLRDQYGQHPFGQGLLLARRLVEAGTRLVQVNWHNDGSDVKSPFWDTHKDNFNSLKNKLLPPFDQAFSTLLDDLNARGLLDETLVVVMGEFGRTPRVGRVVMNAATDASGRDHWPNAYSVLVAGAGTRPGCVYGATDAHAAYVTDKPVSPPDLHATILAALGVDPAASFTDLKGHTLRASAGMPVTGLF